MSDEYTGFKPRASAKFAFYSDAKMSKVHSKKVVLPITTFLPIRQRYEDKKNGQIILETLVEGNLLYAKEDEIYYNYASCAKFKDITIKDLNRLKGTTYTGFFENTVGDRGGGETISDLYNDREQFSRSKFDLQINGKRYGVATFEIITGYCRDRFSIHRILDFIILPAEDEPGDKYIMMCKGEEKMAENFYLISTSYDRSLAKYLTLDRAWHLNRKTLTIEAINPKVLKCRNPCPAGCGP
ncbi:hypothetical protein [Turneriella parva]|uniref:hypothetical protein n=1 Tax=Turneriella parva TaxID=29510 RepID=UPI0005A5405A|nr:hypothetical protein [Turneriella parva]